MNEKIKAAKQTSPALVTRVTIPHRKGCNGKWKGESVYWFDSPNSKSWFGFSCRKCGAKILVRADSVADLLPKGAES